MPSVERWRLDVRKPRNYLSERVVKRMTKQPISALGFSVRQCSSVRARTLERVVCGSVLSVLPAPLGAEP